MLMTDSDQSDVERFSLWLRALAEEVERNPELAAKIQQVAAPAPAHENHEQAHITRAESEHEDRMIDYAANNTAPVDVSVDVPAPILRHRKRSSRYGPPTIEGRTDSKNMGVPDPRQLYAEQGEDGLRMTLQDLRAGTLRAIIRTYQLDPDGTMPAQASEKKMIALIVKAVHGEKRAGRKKS